MADKFIEIEVQNEDRIRRNIEQMEENNERWARELIGDLTRVAESTLTRLVPTHNLYLFRHIHHDGPMWMPGGAGGGGEWKSIVGIKDGPSRHPEYVEFGTGIYGNRGGLIFPNTREGLAFRKRGESDLTGKPIVRRWVRGQKPQKYFYYTWGVVNAFARELIAEKRLFND